MHYIAQSVKTGSPKRTGRVPLFIKIFFLIDLSLCAVYWGNIALFKYALPHGYILHLSNNPADTRNVKFTFQSAYREFDLDEESNIPTWYSSSQMMLVGLLLGVLAYQKFNRRDLGSWALVTAAAMFLFMSMDDCAMFHETIGGKLSELVGKINNGGAFSRTGVWMMFLVPPFLLMCLLVARFTRKYWGGRPDILRKFALGMAVFILSAAGIEIFYNKCLPGTFPEYVEIFSEKLGEMVGMTIMLWAAWDLLVHQGVRLAGSDENAVTF